MKKILVLSAGGPAGVNFIRALNLAQGYEIYAADINPFHLVNIEHDVKKTIKIPKCYKPDYIDTINDIIAKYEIDFLHAQSDAEVRIIANAKDKINTLTFLPSTETIFLCQDKYKTAEIWAEKWSEAEPRFLSGKFTVPKEMEFTKWMESKKSDKFWVRAIYGAGGKGSTPFKDIEVMIAWTDYWGLRDSEMNFIIQEYLPGRNIAWQGIYKRGNLITSQARERVEYIYPNLTASGITGTPSVQRTINDAYVNKNAEKAIKMIDPMPDGVFGVDLKENQSGEPIPTEINAGRFFTTSFFFPYAGAVYKCTRCNMPDIYVKLAFNKPIDEGLNRNILPEDLYWIRHMDCPAQLQRGDTIRYLK